MPDKDKNQPMPEAEPESRPTASGFGYLADKNSEDICRFLQAVIDRAPFGICITDSERHVILANRTIENMTGYLASDLTGQPVTVLYPSDQQDKLPTVNDVKGRKALTKDFEMVGKNGRRLPVRANYVFMPKLIGQDAIMESYSDQTDQARLNQLKNEFVFVAAHELRNPVSAVKLLLDIVFEDKRLTIDPILRDYLLKMQEANERLSQLVDDLLEVSRTEVGRLKIHVSPQSITAEVIRLLGDMRPTAVTKGVTIRYAPSPDTPDVLADALKLKEILTNLMSNAIKYSTDGGKVTISHEVKGDHLYTTITDTGIGIKPQEQKHLFEKFWRSEDMAVRTQAGTGLGLFIVRELVQRMGGEIRAESTYGKGSRFIFSLPIAKESEG